MKRLLLAFAICFAGFPETCPAAEQDPLSRTPAVEPLLPAQLNETLPKLRPGMTAEEVKVVLASAYPEVREVGGEWSGQTGCIAFVLDKRYSLCLGAVIRNDDKEGRREVLADTLRFDLTDTIGKRGRIDVTVNRARPSNQSPAGRPLESR